MKTHLREKERKYAKGSQIADVVLTLGTNVK